MKGEQLETEMLLCFLSGETEDDKLYQNNEEVDWICAWWDGSDKNNGFYFTKHERCGSLNFYRVGLWFETNLNPNGNLADYYEIKEGVFYHTFHNENSHEDIAQFTITIDDVDQITLTSCFTGESLKLYRYRNPER